MRSYPFIASGKGWVGITTLVIPGRARDQRCFGHLPSRYRRRWLAGAGGGGGIGWGRTRHPRRIALRQKKIYIGRRRPPARKTGRLQGVIRVTQVAAPPARYQSLGNGKGAHCFYYNLGNSLYAGRAMALNWVNNVNLISLLSFNKFTMLRMAPPIKWFLHVKLKRDAQYSRVN